MDVPVQNNPRFRMQSHFSRVADAYRSLRTTDREPIFYIREKLKGLGPLTGADIGCGAGRYDRLLLAHLPFSRLFCLDANRDMARQTHRFLGKTQAGRFGALISLSEHLPFQKGALDCMFAFNAIHHFALDAFLREAAGALKPSGRLFIYTRLPEQNEENIWGRHFPGFTEKETRLYGLEYMKWEIERQSALVLEEVQIFRYHRVASPEKLLDQVRERHYSTFSLYTPAELAKAFRGFRTRILAAFPDPERIEWTDGNTMLACRANA